MSLKIHVLLGGPDTGKSAYLRHRLKNQTGVFGLLPQDRFGDMRRSIGISLVCEVAERPIFVGPAQLIELLRPRDGVPAREHAAHVILPGVGLFGLAEFRQTVTALRALGEEADEIHLWVETQAFLPGYFEALVPDSPEADDFDDLKEIEWVLFSLRNRPLAVTSGWFDRFLTTAGGGIGRPLWARLSTLYHSKREDGSFHAECIVVRNGVASALSGQLAPDYAMHAVNLDGSPLFRNRLRAAFCIPIPIAK